MYLASSLPRLGTASYGRIRASLLREDDLVPRMAYFPIIGFDLRKPVVQTAQKHLSGRALSRGRNHAYRMFPYELVKA